MRHRIYSEIIKPARWNAVGKYEREQRKGFVFYNQAYDYKEKLKYKNMVIDKLNDVAYYIEYDCQCDPLCKRVRQ